MSTTNFEFCRSHVRSARQTPRYRIRTRGSVQGPLAPFMLPTTQHQLMGHWKARTVGRDLECGVARLSDTLSTAEPM
jgi:hypothetical protein